MFLVLDRETSKAVHQLALQLGVAWNLDAAAECPECQLLSKQEGSSKSDLT